MLDRIQIFNSAHSENPIDISLKLDNLVFLSGQAFLGQDIVPALLRYLVRLSKEDAASSFEKELRRFSPTTFPITLCLKFKTYNNRYLRLVSEISENGIKSMLLFGKRAPKYFENTLFSAECPEEYDFLCHFQNSYIGFFGDITTEEARYVETMLREATEKDARVSLENGQVSALTYMVGHKKIHLKTDGLNDEEKRFIRQLSQVAKIHTLSNAILFLEENHALNACETYYFTKRLISANPQIIYATNSIMATDAAMPETLNYFFRDDDGVLRCGHPMMTEEAGDQLGILNPAEVWLNYGDSWMEEQAKISLGIKKPSN